MQQATDKQIRMRNAIIGLAIVLVVAALLVVWNRDALVGRWAGGAPPAVESRPEASAVEGSPAQPAARPQPSPPDEEATPLNEGAARWGELVGSAPVWPDDLSSPQSCGEVERAMAAVCAVLDSRAYMQDLAGAGGACGLMKQVGEELAARPPVLSSELRSYESILSNVFHLFRVIGKERMRVLRRALEREGDLAEPLSMALYRWMVSRETCDTEETSAITAESMYDYASFLFNTLGGQAYLRRRAPRVEALACFYALQAMDLSIQRGHNPHGVDPRPEIRRCRAQLAAQSLVFAEEYQRELEAMARRWKMTEGER